MLGVCGSGGSGGGCVGVVDGCGLSFGGNGGGDGFVYLFLFDEEFD